MRPLWTTTRYLRPQPGPQPLMTLRAMSSKSPAPATGQKRSASPAAASPKRAKVNTPKATAEEDDFDQGDIDAEALIAAAEAVEGSASKPATATATTTATAPVPLDSSDPLSLERSTMDSHWFSLLEPAMRTPTFRSLKTFLASEKASKQTIYPPSELIHSWSRSCPLDGVKVVIVGQDPYHGPNQAHGMSFSVPKNVPVPGSLKNIYKELSNEYGREFIPPTHGNLDGWAKQGVLLLNACLTVRAHQAASHHGKGWEPFTIEILKLVAARAKQATGDTKASTAIATAPPPPKNATLTSMFSRQKAKAQGGSGEDKENTSHTGASQPQQEKAEQSGNTSHTGASQPQQEKAEQAGKDSNTNSDTQTRGGIVFLSWGLPASKTLAAAGITKSTPNVLILQSAHPSPLSAHRGFLGNGHFKRANEWLTGVGGWGERGGIEWGRL